MAVRTHKRPDLREPIEKLLHRLLPAIRDGGSLPIVSLVEAVVGDRLAAKARDELDARGDVALRLEGAGVIFSNEGPELVIALRRFDIRIPRRIAGAATLVDGGALLRFSPRETLTAAKLFFSVPLQHVELTERRVFVKMEGSAFDQSFELA